MLGFLIVGVIAVCGAVRDLIAARRGGARK